MPIINGKKIISIVRTNYLSETEHDLIARYHLGVADSVSESSGITTITRKTDYIDLGSLNWVYDTIYGGAYGFVATGPSNLKPSGSVSNIPNVSTSKYQTISDSQAYSGTNGICIYADDTRIGIVDSNYTDAATFKTAIQGVLLQYETVTSYTETVIKNQPLNTLDQQGSQWLRNEWEKGLNLFDNDLEVIANSYLETRNYIAITPNTTYTIRYYGTIVEYPTVVMYYYDKTYTQIGTFSMSVNWQSSTFTTPNNAYYVKIALPSSLGTTYQNDIMLNEGDHAYPYQEHRGEIVRSGEVPVSFTTDNNPPTTYGNWEALGSVTIGTNTLYAWRRL